MRRTLFAAFAAVALLAGCGGDDGDSGDGVTAAATPNTTAIELPDTLGDFRDFLTVAEADGAEADQLDDLRERDTRTGELTVERYTDAFGGSAVAYRAYADPERQAGVIAVRTEAPGVTFGPVVDPASLRLAKPLQEVVEQGDAECLVRWQPVPEDSEPADDDQQVVSCQVVADGLTVFASGSGFDGAAGTADLAQLATDAHTAIS